MEDATLEKLGTARDVREHGLVALHPDASIDWKSFLTNAREVSVVTHDPRGLFGRADDLFLQQAGNGTLRKLVIAVPEEHWDDAAPWLKDFTSRWKSKCPAAKIFAMRIESASRFELVATEGRYMMLVPALAPAQTIPAAKMLEFKDSGVQGIGEWLQRQFLHIQSLKGEIGYSPPEPARRKRAD